MRQVVIKHVEKSVHTHMRAGRHGPHFPLDNPQKTGVPFREAQMGTMSNPTLERSPVGFNLIDGNEDCAAGCRSLK
jgi:hypothetical protein